MLSIEPYSFDYFFSLFFIGHNVKIDYFNYHHWDMGVRAVRISDVFILEITHHDHGILYWDLRDGSTEIAE